MKDPWDALSDPTRREILKLLRGSPLNASAISQNFPFTKSTISRHLEVLEDSGLIESEKRKQYVYYQLKRDALRPLRDYLVTLEENPTEQEIGKAGKDSPSLIKKLEKTPVAKKAEPVERDSQGDTEKAVPLEKPAAQRQSHISPRKGKVPSYLD